VSMCMDCECKLKQRTVCVTCSDLLRVKSHRLSFPSESGDGPYERWLLYLSIVPLYSPSPPRRGIPCFCCVCVCVYV